MRHLSAILFGVALGCGAESATETRIPASQPAISATTLPSDVMTQPTATEGTRVAWGDLLVSHVDGDDDRVDLRDQSGKVTTLVADQYVVELRLVELDGSAPNELWVATSAGAHGNRTDYLFALDLASEGGRPKQILEIATDEGEIEIRDADGDGAAEIRGNVTEWFEPSGEDIARPLFLKRRSGAWVDVTREHRDALEANLEAWKEAVRRSTSCSRAQASNIVAIAVLLGSEASADRFLRESCELEVPWVRANRGRIRAVALQPYFKS